MNDELLIKFLLKETSEEENIAVTQWLADDEGNLASFTQFSKIWEASKKLGAVSRVDENIAWNKFQEKASALPKEKISPHFTKETATVIPLKETRSNYSWLKIAAIFVLAVGSWLLYNTFKPSSYTELAAGNEVNTTVLPDGSSITLNKKSLLSYASNFKNNRSIHLDSGDVFFNVAHDKTKPFVIKTDQVSVEVVGTSFNVKHLNKQTEVIVETGIVKVTLGTEEIKLTKGEKVVISSNSKKLLKIENTDQLYNYYRSRQFEINNTPLWKVAEVLTEAYGKKITVAPEARALTLHTTLKFDSLEHNLDIICQVLDLSHSNNEQEILLFKTKQ